jgi:hypothetical protein
MVSEEIRAMIPDYVRGMLTAGEAREVEAALAAFPEISGELEAARVYYAALNQIPEVRASAGFLRKVNHRIDYKPFVQRLRSILFEPLYIKLPIELAGVAACMFVVLIIFNPLRLPKERLSTTETTLALNETKSSVPPAETIPSTAPAVPEPEKMTPEADFQAADKETVPEAASQNQKDDQQPAVQEAGKKEEAREAGPQKPEVAFAAERAPVPAPAAAAPAAEKPRPAAMAMEQKTELQPEAPAVRKAFMPPSAGRLDAIPDLNNLKAKKAAYATASAAPAAPAPAAADAGQAAPAPAPALKKEIARVAPPAAAPVQTTEEIGTIELAANTAESGSANAVLLILRTYDPNLKNAVRSGKQTFVCTFPPARLSALINDLGGNFSVTTHLFPYDTQRTKRITILFILQ